VESLKARMATTTAALLEENTRALATVQEEHARSVAQAAATMAATQTTVSSMQSALAQAEQEKQTIIARWTEEQSIYESTVRALEESRASNVELQKRLTDIVASSSSHVPKSEHDALQSHLAALASKYESALGSMESLKKECRQFLSQEAEFKAQIDRAQKEAAAADLDRKDVLMALKSAQLAALEAEKHAAGRVATLQQELAALKTEHAELQAKHTSLSNELSEMSVHTSNDLFTSSAEIVKLRELCAEQKTEVDRLKAHLRENAAHSKSLSADHALETDQLRAEMQVLNTEIENLQVIASNYTHVQEKYRELQVENQSNLVSMQNLQNALESMQSSTEAEIARLQGELNELQSGRDPSSLHSSSEYAVLQSQYAQLDTDANFQKQQNSNYAKYIMTLQLENATIRKGLESTMERLKTFSNDENLIDRRLVVKMVSQRVWLVAHRRIRSSRMILILICMLLSVSFFFSW
jgi:chromosome segregation ATPase